MGAPESATPAVRTPRTWGSCTLLATAKRSVVSRGREHTPLIRAATMHGARKTTAPESATPAVRTPRTHRSCTLLATAKRSVARRTAPTKVGISMGPGIAELARSGKTANAPLRTRVLFLRAKSRVVLTGLTGPAVWESTGGVRRVGSESRDVTRCLLRLSFLFLNNGSRP